MPNLKLTKSGQSDHEKLFLCLGTKPGHTGSFHTGALSLCKQTCGVLHSAEKFLWDVFTPGMGVSQCETTPWCEKAFFSCHVYCLNVVYVYR